MKVTDIKDSKFLKDYNDQQLKELAQEIRSFLLENISKTGGHLSSNLGVVELFLAIHQCFDLDRDRLFIDIGHQSYVHKILTGRAGKFATLRKYGGLSGFQKRQESPYDHWEAGHAGTALSAALGDKVAGDNCGNKHHTVVVIGDAAIANGEAFEALNHIGSLKKPLIIILNDNQMSISKQNTAFSRSLSRMRSSSSYRNLKGDVRKLLNRSKFGKATVEQLSKFKTSLKYMMLQENYFDDLGLNYFGPVNGHNFKELRVAINYAKLVDRPVLIHVRTVKGKGYQPSQSDTSGNWHGVSAFNIEEGELNGSLPPDYLSWSKALAKYLEELADKHQELAVITPAMKVGSGLEAFFEKYPQRAFDCGIAEEHAATFAAGLALAGMKPFLSIYSTFLQRAYDQINHDICRMNLPVIIGIDRAGIVGEDGDTHHGVFDIGILKPLPNIVIAQGKNYSELCSLLDCAYKSKQPFALRYPRGNVKITAEQTSKEEIAVGTWTKVESGKKPQLIIITYGPWVETVYEKFLSNNISALVVNARFIKPLDQAMLRQLAQMKLPIVCYESDMLVGGLSGSILEFFNDEKINCKLERIGIGDHYIQHGSISELRKQEKIDINSLLEFVAKLCD